MRNLLIFSPFIGIALGLLIGAMLTGKRISVFDQSEWPTWLRDKSDKKWKPGRGPE